LVDAAAVEAEIERTVVIGAALRRRWQSEFGRPPVSNLTADLLRRMIANRIPGRQLLQFAASVAALPTVSRLAGSQVYPASSAFDPAARILPCRCHAFFQFLHGRFAEL
jgi:hypothetical protein